MPKQRNKRAVGAVQGERPDQRVGLVPCREGRGGGEGAGWGEAELFLCLQVIALATA